MSSPNPMAARRSNSWRQQQKNLGFIWLLARRCVGAMARPGTKRSSFHRPENCSPFTPNSGRSLIVDPQGTILADAGTAEGFISAQLDLANLRKYREGLPFLADLKR